MGWDDLQALYDQLGTYQKVADHFGCSIHKVQNEMRKRGVTPRPRGLPQGYTWTDARRAAHRAALARPEVKAKNRANLLKRLPTMRGTSANSPLERLLQSALRRAGLSFSTQRTKLGRYVVDIELQQASVIIEADGALHRLPDHRRRDEERDAALTAAGYRVFRFDGKVINADPDGCIREVIAACDLTPEREPTADIRPGMMGPDNHQWRGGKETYRCDWCGTEFMQYRTNRQYVKKFCSEQCYGDWRRAHPEQNPVHARWAKRRATRS